MSVITIPAGIQVHQFAFGQQDYSLTFQAGDTGTQQSRILAPSRWTCTMTINLSVGQSVAAAWRTMVLQLRGKTNQLAVYDVKNPAPAGTMRGTLTLNASTGAVAVGGTTLNISGGAGQAGTTLKAGDWIGVGSGSTRQLFSVQADATADGSGNITVTVEPPSRYAQTASTTVTWDKPTCLMRRTDSAHSWMAVAAAEGGASLSLIESWE